MKKRILGASEEIMAKDKTMMMITIVLKMEVAVKPIIVSKTHQRQSKSIVCQQVRGNIQTQN